MYKPTFTPREQRIMSILLRTLGPDPAVPAETHVHYDVDASFLNMMLDAHPSEAHIVAYLAEAQPRSNVSQRTEAARKLIALLS